MATRNGKSAETGTETQTTALELDVATAPPATPVTVAEPEADPRDSALAALVFGGGEPVIAADEEPEVDAGNVIDFGGRSKAVVLFSRYNQLVDGEFKQARKGDVIATDADSMKRGVKIGALRKLTAEDSE